MNFGPDTVKNVLKSSISNNGKMWESLLHPSTRTQNSRPQKKKKKQKWMKRKHFKKAMSNGHHFKVNHVYDVRVYECMKNYLTNRGISIIWQSNRSNLDSMTMMTMMMTPIPNHYTHLPYAFLFSFSSSFSQALTHTLKLTLQRFPFDSL